MRILRSIATSLAFLAGLGLACWGIGRVLPFPEVLVVQAKVEHLRAHPQTYNTVFLGSSRIYHQIIPEAFDASMAKTPWPTQSFNAACDGMYPPEDAFMFDEILASRSKNLQWVFIELAPIRAVVDQDKVGTLRGEYWQDSQRLGVLWRHAINPRKSERKRRTPFAQSWDQIATFADHLGPYMRNLVHLGRGERFTHLCTENRLRPIAWWPIGDRRDGWAVSSRPEVITESNRKKFQEDLAARKAQPALANFGDSTSQDALAEMIRKVEATGAVPVLVVPPTTRKTNFLPSPLLQGRLIVLDYSDIEKYASLYEDRHRLDSHHLNTEGARLFTRMLVEDFAAALRASSPANAPSPSPPQSAQPAD